MQHRYLDVRKSGDSKWAHCTHFIGGTEHADLWLVESTNVLVCQYEYPYDYVSYIPASTVLHHARGPMVRKFADMDVTQMPPLADVLGAGARDFWGNYERLMEDGVHKPAEIARYLAVFYPDIFTEDEREEALGITLTEQGELK